MGKCTKYDDLQTIYVGSGITYYMLDYFDFKVYLKTETNKKIVYCGKQDKIGDKDFSNPQWVLNIFDVKPDEVYCYIPKN